MTGKRIGLVIEGFEGCDKGVQDIVREATGRLETVGAVVEDMSVPLHKKGSVTDKTGFTKWQNICVFNT